MHIIRPLAVGSIDLLQKHLTVQLYVLRRVGAIERAPLRIHHLIFKSTVAHRRIEQRRSARI